MVLLFAVATATAATAQVPAPKQNHPKRAHVSKPAPAPPAPQPERAKFPAELPPVAPNVTYANGLLSIDAPNSNLSDVLTAVRRVTGASVEGGGSDRIVVHLGPGRPRDVMTALLQGSRYDYIILGPKGDPGGVQRVMLMARAGASAGNGEAPPQGLPGTAVAPSEEQQSGKLNPDEDDDVADREPEEVSPKGEIPPEQQGPPQQQQGQQQQLQAQPQQAQPGQQQGQPQTPGQPAIGPQSDQPQDQQQQQQNPQVKTPEQLYKELQQLQQQKQQQQQGPPH